MGRKMGSFFGSIVDGKNPLMMIDNKRLLPLGRFVKEMEKKGYNFEVFKNHEDQDSAYYTENYNPMFPKPIFIVKTKNHVEPKKFKMTYKVYEQFNNHGKMIFEIEANTLIFGSYFCRELRKMHNGDKDAMLGFDKKQTKIYLNDPNGCFNIRIDEIEDQVGTKGTYIRFPETGLSRKHHNLALNYFPPTSSWMENIEPEKGPKIISNSKLRAGTDGYKLHHFIDPSSAWLRSSSINEFGPVMSLKQKTNVKLNWEGFIWNKTKAGLLKRRIERKYRSINPGMGNHYNNTPEESLIASGRIGRTEKKPQLTNESVRYARELARETFTKHWRKDYVVNKEKLNYVVYTAIKAIKQRNYQGRFDAEIKKSFDLTLTCSNKDQFKPIKNHKLNLTKGGQVLLQSPARINLQFIGYMRAHSFLFKDALQPDVFTDDYESPIDFRVRMTQAISKLPTCSRVAIADGEQWDSQQNPVTLEIEKEMKRLFGASDQTINDYFVVRGNLPFIMHGIFKGVTNGEKGSGFLDTKNGNTTLAVTLGSKIIDGVGPKVVGCKGDDYARVQAGITINDKEVERIKKLCGMKLDVTVGDGGEFCGNSISRYGMYPSITRMAMKIMALKANSVDKFYEKQISIRDKIREILASGLVETIKYSALAESVSENYVTACFEFLNSMAHINKEQWLSVTRVRKPNRYYLPSYDGFNLI